MKRFKSKFTGSKLEACFYGDEGICIKTQSGHSVKHHVFNNDKEVRHLIKQLKLLLD